MNNTVQAQGFKVSDDLNTFLHEKLSKLGEHTDKIIRADVTLFMGAAGELQNNYCEIRLVVPGNDHFAKKNSSSFEHAIVESVHALQHMLEKSKEREKSKSY